MRDIRIKRYYEKQEFQIQSLIQQKDDNIALLCQIDQEYQNKILELKERSQKISNDIYMIKIQNFNNHSSRKTDKKTKIAQAKAKFNNEIIELQNSFREEQNQVHEEYQQKLDQFNNKNENHISLILLQLNKQMSFVKTTLETISSKYNEAQSLASMHTPSHVNQNDDENYILSIKQSLQQKLNEKQEERKQKLLILKNQLKQCVDTLTNEEEYYQNELKNGQNLINEMNEKYEKT